MQRTVEDARESQVNPALTIGAIVATRYNRTKEAKDCVEQMRHAFPDTMLQTVVRESARLGEALQRTRERSGSTTLAEWVQSTTGLSLASLLSAGGSCLRPGKAQPVTEGAR